MRSILFAILFVLGFTYCLLNYSDVNFAQPFIDIQEPLAELVELK